MDNLNTHRLSSLYETFEPAEASRLADRFEVRHTPKHGSWLNMAEIEINVLSRQCLDRRIPDRGRWSARSQHGRSAATLPQSRQLAIQDRGRTHQAEVALSFNTMMPGY